MHKIILFTLLVTISWVSNLFAGNIVFKVDTNYDVIHLVGEDHEVHEDLEIRDQLIREAASGNIILAYEGEIFGQNIGLNTFGIEEKDMFELGALALMYKDFVMHKFLHELRYEKTPSLALQDKLGLYSNSFFDHPLDKLTLLVDVLHELRVRDEVAYDLFAARNRDVILGIVNVWRRGDQAFSKLVEDHTFQTPFFLKINPDTTKWINLCEDMISAYNPDAANSLRNFAEQFLRKCKKPNGFIKWGCFEENWEKFQLVAHSITVDLRDKVFLKNVVHIFEDNKFREKPFYVSVGYSHIPFLYKELKLKGYKVQVDGPFQERSCYVFLQGFLKELEKDKEL